MNICNSLQPRAFKNLVNAHFDTVACAKLYEISVSRQFRAIEPPNPARGFIQQSENVRLQPRAFKNLEMYVLLQRRAQNCMKHVSDVRSSSRHHFRTALKARRTRNNEKVAANSRLTTVLDVRRPGNDDSLGPDDHEMMKGLLGELQILLFATIFDVQRPRNEERVVSCVVPPNPPCLKKKGKILKGVPFRRAALSSAAFKEQPSSAAFEEQPSSAAFKEQPFSAALKCSHPRQTLKSSHSQQLFSAAILSSLYRAATLSSL